jgi:hypothetical protein
VRGKRREEICHKKSMEILWKSCNNILWTTDDSAIGRINICGDPDSAIGSKKQKKKSPGATVLGKITIIREAAFGCPIVFQNIQRRPEVVLV